MNKLFLALMLSFTIAQEDTRGDFDQDGWSYDETTRAERRESMVIWRLTEDLDLSSEQAEKFFPRFREHRANLDEYNKDERKMLMDVRVKIRDGEELSKSEMEKTIKKVVLVIYISMQVQVRIILNR